MRNVQYCGVSTYAYVSTFYLVCIASLVAVGYSVHLSVAKPPIAVYGVRCTLMGERWGSIAFHFVALWVGLCVFVGWSGSWMVCCSLRCGYSLFSSTETGGVVEKRRDIRELRVETERLRQIISGHGC